MYIVISASPNSDGLTAACTRAALTGLREAGAEARHIDLCQLNLERCRQCGNGWGCCLQEHACVIEDDFRVLHGAVVDAEGIILISPVYWGEMAESVKLVFDRLRRCEATRAEKSALVNKWIIAIAAAGGSGNGVISCLQSMERLIQHMRAQVQDLIGITQRSRAYKVETIRTAAKTMAQTGMTKRRPLPKAKPDT